MSADIAPLGFEVDTAGLLAAENAAKSAAVQITGVADAADKVGDSTKKAGDAAKTAADSTKTLGDAHTKTGAAAKTSADGHANLAAKVKESDVAMASAAAGVRDLAAQHERLHAMVERSLAKMQQTQGVIAQGGGSLGGLMPKNLAAQAFEHSIEAKAARTMGPTEADIAKQALATKQAEAFRKEMEAITRAVDPAAAKMQRFDHIIEELGRKFDAKKLGPAEYNKLIAQVGAAEDALENPGASRNHPHNTFVGEAGRAFTYGIPRFGREARRLINEGESEEQGGSIGQGLMGFATLGAGAAVGMIGVTALRTIMKLPEEMAKASDAEQNLERRFTSFGDVGAAAFERTEQGMTKLVVGIKAGMAALIEFHAQFTRLGTSVADQDKAFETAVAAGRLGGLDEAQRTKSAISFAGIAQKTLVSGSEISSLNSENPTLAQGIAKGMGLGSVTALQTAAAQGNVTGEQLLAAAVRVNQMLVNENTKLPKNALELQAQAKEANEKLMVAQGDGIEKFFANLTLKINNGLLHLYGKTGVGESGGGSSVTMRLPERAGGPSAAFANAIATLQGKYGSYGTTQKENQLDLNTTNGLLAQAPGNSTLQAVRRELQATLAQAAQNPLKQVNDQIDDLTRSIGGGAGNTGLTAAWQQALQIQRQQTLDGHHAAESFETILDRVLALKRGLQDLSDVDEIKKLSDSLAVIDARMGAVGQGSFTDKVASHDVEMKQWMRDQSQYDSAGGGSPSGGSSVQVSGRSGFSDGGSDAYNYFKGKYGEEIARGIAAGITAEGGSTGMAANGAFGRGQWRGRRQAELMRRTGTVTPTEGQQFQFMDWELQGGDKGMASVLHATNAQDALTRYITNGMRPGSGTAADLRRGYAALGLRGSIPVAGGSGAGAADPDARNKLFGLKDAAFYQAMNLEAEQKIGDANFSTANQANVSNAYAAGGDEGAVHRAELEAKIADEVRSLPPAYRDAYAAATRLKDAGEVRLKVEQEIKKLNDGAEENNKRAAAARLGGVLAAAKAELDIKQTTIRDGPGTDAEKGRQLTALDSETASNSSISVNKVIGAEQQRTKALQEQLALSRFGGEELAKQKAMLDAHRQIEENSLKLTHEQISAAEAEVDALIKGNEVLQRRLTLVSSITDGFAHATDKISAGWSQMFQYFEAHGKLRTAFLIRGIEDGFYQMFDDIEKKLVISPLMSALENLVNSLTKSLLGSFGGGGGATAAAGSSGGGFSGFGSATGNVFGPHGLTPFASGGIFSTPTRFFAGGGTVGMAGEGPGSYEAIMPLQRGADGKLGVANRGGGGGGGTTINVIDQRGPGAEAVEIQERAAGNGMRQVDIMLRDGQRANVRGGRMDADMRTSYGISRPAVRR